ncbi:uncharacterized protein BYT42DRAFT_414870 [Radiomyces spectabilis]|uniref:uncharacterized protein n=1 Tax=Radiomyces spectabilis TaxID=64574 RepID=UPI0022207F06|nr:uncharacterized protein BYT42DRAFT_414870 [Radiomyces spectabilis]KAI8374660.1 hypothetical protein BYT42DRAFT_414870 [Radiomyces spectabilis]
MAMVPKEHFGKRETQQTYIQKTRDFIASYQKTQALAKQYDEHDTLYHRQWQKIPVYSNMHSPSTYIKANYKNNIAVLYVEDGTVDFDGLFPNHSAMPWIVALVQPDLRGFRYQISSKVHLERIQQFFKPSSATNQEGQPIDFEMVFWDNILLCERQLRLSPVFSYANDFVTEEEIQKQTRSKATTRSGTLAPFNKLFSSSNSNLQANRTQRDQRRPPPSPIRPVNSTSLPMSTGNTNATRDVSATATWRSAPITQDPYNDTDDTTCSSQSAKTEPEHPAPPKKQRYPLAQLKLPSSSLGEDIASQLRRQSHENLVREYCGVQASHRREDELTITSPSDLNLRRASIISYPSPTTPNFDRPLSYHQPVSSPGPMHWIQNRPGTGDSHLSLANTLSSFTSSLSTNSSAASDDTSITRLAENPDDLVQKLQQLLLTQPIADNRMEQISQTAEKLKVQWKLLSQKHKEMHDYVSELMEKTAKIDGEISIVSNAYNEVYTETCSLYDKFNQELDQLTDLVQPRSTCTTGSKSSLHSEAHEQVSGNTLTLTEKLWEAETEKEHWQQRAM